MLKKQFQRLSYSQFLTLVPWLLLRGPKLGQKWVKNSRQSPIFGPRSKNRGANVRNWLYESRWNCFLSILLDHIYMAFFLFFDSHIFRWDIDLLVKFWCPFYISSHDLNVSRDIWSKTRISVILSTDRIIPLQVVTDRRVFWSYPHAKMQCKRAVKPPKMVFGTADPLFSQLRPNRDDKSW